MVTNISLEIYRELYKLLFLIIKNENAVDIHDILHANSEEGVERKIL